MFACEEEGLSTADCASTPVRWWKLPYYYAGVKAYDLVAGKRGLESSYFLTKNRALLEFPMLHDEGLKGAVVYYDGRQEQAL